jgi:DNA-binding CsgD family transcriptional regulator
VNVAVGTADPTQERPDSRNVREFGRNSGYEVIGPYTAPRVGATDGSKCTMPHLIDRIYECAFVPELWPGILGDLASLSGARHGWLCVSNDTVLHWTASSERARAFLQPLMESGWIPGAERFARLLHARQTGFVSDSTLYTPEEMAADPTYRDLLRPVGLGWASGTAIPLPTGDNLAIVLEREYVDGSSPPSVTQALNEIHAHLARTSLVAARLQLARARVASETLASIGIPALVLEETGKIVSANRLIEALIGHIHWRADDRMAFKDSKADTLFRAAMATLGQDSPPNVRSFPVRGAEKPLVAHVMPIRLSARDIFSRCAAMLMLTPVTRPKAPSVELVRSLFDLTPAEAGVARGIAAGQTVENLAAERGASMNTIRAHVRGILAKTGYNRQADVISLLNGIWVLPSRS